MGEMMVGVIIGAVVGSVLNHFVFEPLRERYYMSKCIKNGLLPLQWFYRWR